MIRMVATAAAIFMCAGSMILAQVLPGLIGPFDNDVLRTVFRSSGQYRDVIEKRLNSQGVTLTNSELAELQKRVIEFKEMFSKIDNSGALDIPAGLDQVGRESLLQALRCDLCDAKDKDTSGVAKELLRDKKELKALLMARCDTLLKLIAQRATSPTLIPRSELQKINNHIFYIETITLWYSGTAKPSNT